MNKDKLLEEYLYEYIQKIRNTEIYEHGYSESRLIPSNHFENCNESFIDDVIEKVSEKVKEILESNIRKESRDYDF